MFDIRDIGLCVFDMAGTTVDEDNIVYKTLQKSIQALGIEVDLQSCLTYGSGKEKSKAIYDVLNSPNVKSGLSAIQVSDLDNLTQEAFAKFKILLETAYTPESIKAFDGMEEFFQFLHERNIKVVLNTGYDRKTAEKILDILGWKVGETVDFLITADDVEQGRPAPDMILSAMQKTNIQKPIRVLKAGDTCVDIEEGRNAGCEFLVAVLTGAQTEQELKMADPKIILNRLTDLRKYLA